MAGLEITVLLGASVLVGAMLAPRIRVAAPLILVILGLLLGFIPALQNVELPPETVLLVFLPVMLFWESLTTSLRSIRRDLRGIAIMSTLLVVATAFGVAGIATLFGMPWQAALILGAAVAPPDATAVGALGRLLPHRNFMLLKAESLTNDGTALVLYSIAVGVAVGGTYTPWTITGMVLLSYGGGFAIGIAAAALAFFVMRRLRDALTINIALLLTPFVCYLAAELVGASGVLAVVVTGLILAYLSNRVSTAESRRQTQAAWPLGTYLLNGALFVLIGLQVQAIAHDIDPRDIGRLALITVAAWATLLVVRFGFQSLSVFTIRVLDRRPSQRERRMTWRARIVSTMAGFRGAVSLAIALSVPMTLSDGTPLPSRDAIVFVTGGVILLTLLVQGPLLPAIVRWARLPEDTTATDELQLAERVITGAALLSVDELARANDVSDAVRDRLARESSEKLELANARAAQLSTPDALDALTAAHPGAAAEIQDATALVAGDDDPLARHAEYARLQLAMLTRKRDVLLMLVRKGAVDDTVARKLEARLDTEELRLTGVTAPG